MNIVIMAGGGGSRLWPVSREKLPKQFTRLVGRKTLLQATFARARAVVPDVRHIVVTTVRAYALAVLRQLPELPRGHILAEPARRDTAPSVGMAAAFFAAKGKHDEPLVQIPSDHLVKNEALFRMALRSQGTLLKEHADRTVLLGAEPTYPETGLGYIERGSRVGRTLGMPVYAVRRFVEKPDLNRAKHYVSSGRFLWNMGIYGWRVGTLLALFHTYQPAIARRLDRLQHLLGARASARARGRQVSSAESDPMGTKALERVYRGMPSISLDYAITERQHPSSLLVLPGEFGWSDVGHWASLAEVLGGRAAAEIKRGAVLGVKVSGNFVYCDSPVMLGLVGVHNLIIVATPDAVLVCDKRNVQDVKTLVRELRRRRYKRLL